MTSMCVFDAINYPFPNIRNANLVYLFVKEAQQQDVTSDQPFKLYHGALSVPSHYLNN